MPNSHDMLFRTLADPARRAALTGLWMWKGQPVRQALFRKAA